MQVLEPDNLWLWKSHTRTCSQELLTGAGTLSSLQSLSNLPANETSDEDTALRNFLMVHGKCFIILIFLI